MLIPKPEPLSVRYPIKYHSFISKIITYLSQFYHTFGSKSSTVTPSTFPEELSSNAQAVQQENERRMKENERIKKQTEMIKEENERRMKENERRLQEWKQQQQQTTKKPSDNKCAKCGQVLVKTNNTQVHQLQHSAGKFRKEISLQNVEVDVLVCVFLIILGRRNRGTE